MLGLSTTQRPHSAFTSLKKRNWHSITTRFYSLAVLTVQCNQWWMFRQNDDISVSWLFMVVMHTATGALFHDDVIKWKHFPRYWPCVRGIHRSPVNSPHKGQWRGALMFTLIWDWANGWVNNPDAGDLRHHRAHYDATVIWWSKATVVQTVACHLMTPVWTNVDSSWIWS